MVLRLFTQITESLSCVRTVKGCYTDITRRKGRRSWTARTSVRLSQRGRISPTIVHTRRAGRSSDHDKYPSTPRAQSVARWVVHHHRICFTRMGGSVGVVCVRPFQHRRTTERAGNHSDHPGGRRTSTTRISSAICNRCQAAFPVELLRQSCDQRLKKPRWRNRRRCRLVDSPSLQRLASQGQTDDLVASVGSGADNLDHQELVTQPGAVEGR